VAAAVVAAAVVAAAVVTTAALVDGAVVVGEAELQPVIRIIDKIKITTGIKNLFMLPPLRLFLTK